MFDIVEGVHVCDIVDDTDAVGAAIVRGGNGAESFLTSSIPLGEPSQLDVLVIHVVISTYDLQLHGLAIEFNCPDFLPLSANSLMGSYTLGSYEVDADS